MARPSSRPNRVLQWQPMQRDRPDLSLREYGPSRGSHNHVYFQVLVGLDGVLELEVEGREQRIGVGEAFLVAPGARHEFESRGRSSCLVLDSHDVMWSRCLTSPRQPAQVHALARYLAHALMNRQPLAALHGPALLLEAWLPGDMVARARPRRHIDWTALSTWTQARLHEPLTVADLAAQAHLSASQLGQRCRETNGVAPMEWLRMQRLARARQLLAAGCAVGDSARRSGYRSPSALTAALRRLAH